MRDLERETILVTGATDGLGKRVVSELAQIGAPCYCKAEIGNDSRQPAKKFGEETGSEKPRYYLTDFSSLGDVRELAGQILSEVGTCECVSGTLRSVRGLGKPGEGRTHAPSDDRTRAPVVPRRTSHWSAERHLGR